MHDHNYLITFLKTPLGFLTKTGFTQDINSKDILLLPSNTYGKYSTMLGRIKYFCDYYNLEQQVFEKLYEYLSECETITYQCDFGLLWCDTCCYKNNCSCWNADRAQLDLHKLYGL